MIMFENLTLSDLPRKHCGILRKPSGSRPFIWIVEGEDGVRAVVKDFSSKRFFTRNTMGRFLVWRESKAYERLQDLKGVPTLYRVIDGLALVLEEIPGRNIEKLEKERKLPNSFFDALERLVKKIHERGVVHCDLKRAPNTLIGNDGLPYIVDWGASIFKSEFRFFPLSLVYRRFLRDDHMAIIKLKLRHQPQGVSGVQRARYFHQSAVEKAIRALRDRLRRIAQKLA